MSFSVSYTYKLIDKYTPKLKEIERQTAAFNKQITHLHRNSARATNALNSIGKASKAANRGMKQLSASTKKVNKFSGAMGKAGKKMTGFATSAAGITASLGAGLGLKTAVMSAVNLETAMVGVAKVFGDAGESTVFQDSLAKVGRTIGQSRIEMNKLAAAAGKLGIPIDEVAKFAELTGKVAIAFDTDLGEATVFLADMRTKLGLNNKELRETLDVVNTLADSTSASGANILEITQRLAGTFKELKIPPAVGVGLATVARQLATSPQLAASGMKMFIQRLKTTTKFGTGLTKSLLGDPEGTINSVLGKLRKMDRVTRALKIQDIFGAEAASFVANLVASQDLYNRTMGIANDKTKTAGSMNREFTRATATTGFAIQQAKAAMSDMAGVIGAELAPAFKSFLFFIVSAADGIAKFVKGHPMLTKIAAVMMLIATVVAPLALTLGTLFAIIGSAGVASMAAFAGTAITAVAPFLAIAAAIGAAVYGIYKLGTAVGLFDEIDLISQFEGEVASMLGFGDGPQFNMAEHHKFTGPRMPSPGETSAAASGAKNSFQGSIDNNINLSLPAGFSATTESFTSAMPSNIGLNAAGSF